MRAIPFLAIALLVLAFGGCDDDWIGCGQIFRHEYNAPYVTWHTSTHCSGSGSNQSCYTTTYPTNYPATFYLHVRESASKNHTMRVNQYEYERWNDGVQACWNKDDSITAMRNDK